MESIRFDDVEKLRSKISPEYSGWSQAVLQLLKAHANVWPLAVSSMHGVGEAKQTTAPDRMQHGGPP